MNRAEKRRQQKKAAKAAKQMVSEQEANGSPEQQMLFIQQSLDLALRHFTAGRFPRAEKIYQQILQDMPDHPVALHMLGLTAHKMGKNDIVVDLISRSVSIAPDYIDAHRNLGNALRDFGKLEEAVASYRKANALDPNYAPAHYNLGNVLRALGKLEEAVASYRKAIALDPNYAFAHNNLGNALKDLGKLDEAVASYHNAIAIDPNYAATHNNLGGALTMLRKFDEATESFRKSTALDPNYAVAHINLGNALMIFREYDDAAANFRKAIALDPSSAAAHCTLANALRDFGNLEEAVASYHKAIALDPHYAAAYNNLGIAHLKLEQLDEAIASYHKAISLNPNFAAAYNNLGNALMMLGEFDEAAESFRKSLDLKQDSANLHSNLLMNALYRNGMTIKLLKDMHAEWDESFGYPRCKEWPKHENQRDMEKRLRIGFVSTDFCRHPVGYLLVKLLENTPQDEIEFICYSNCQPDDMTERLKNASEGWVDTNGMADETLVERIRSDGIDILFDLSGHSAGNKLLIFARKPAPIQVSWGIGYPGTTGLKAIDYVLADNHHIPIKEEQLYSEKIIRMPDSMFCYDPPEYAPTVGPLPAKHHNFVTFGSFNNPSKINSEVMAAWAKVLEAVPGSRLFLKYKGINSRAARERLLSPFLDRGLDADRLILEGASPHQELLDCYNDIDIALDTFPYSGGVTTCEALWMGVPVITIPGKTPAGRHTLSHLSGIGLVELAVENEARYVELAVELAGDFPRLASMRSGLRGRMAKSPLCDGPKFARYFNEEMRNIWYGWCREKGE